MSSTRKKRLIPLSILLAVVVALVVGLVHGGVFDHNNTPDHKATTKAIGADVLGIRTGKSCQTYNGTTSCPGFEIHGPEAITQGFPGTIYSGKYAWEHGSGVYTCPTDPVNYPYVSGEATKKYSGYAKVGGKTASYMEWVVPCKSSDFSKGITYVQKLWWLPQSKILIVDEWNTPGLAETLKNATWQ